jgi:hypothetical protein
VNIRDNIVDCDAVNRDDAGNYKGMWRKLGLKKIEIVRAPVSTFFLIIFVQTQLYLGLLRIVGSD